MLRIFLLALVFLFFSQKNYGQDTIPSPFSFKWDNGFQLKSVDSLFSLSFGGQIMVDHAHFFQDSHLDKTVGKLENKSVTKITSARLYFSGNVYKNVEFKFQIELAGEKVDFKDVYIGVTDIPIAGNLRIGNLHEPFRLSTLTSGKYITFMERGANSHFSPARSIGAVLFNDFFEDRVSIQIGVFQNSNTSSVVALKHDGNAITGRMTFLPLRNTDKTQLLHVGGAYSFRKPASGEYRASISPGSRIADKYLETENISRVNHIGMANFEVAYIQGALSFQSEFLTAAVNSTEHLYHFSNYYGELSYFLTGESKNYKSSYEGFGRVKPKNNISRKEMGLGAWEVAIGYSETNLNDGAITAGKQSQITLGMNWYLNPVTRVMFNYVHASIEKMGNVNLVQARFQIDF